ncbi:MAG: hypothetical protein AAF666_04535 [Pseudomonadota bacterium]
MTTLVTRLYKDKRTASDVAQSLMDHSFRPAMLDVISAGGDIQNQLKAAQVPSALMEDYASGLQGGNALLVVRAPFGNGRSATRIVDETDALAGDTRYVRKDVSLRHRNSILTDHPRFMSR